MAALEERDLARLSPQQRAALETLLWQRSAPRPPAGAREERIPRRSRQGDPPPLSYAQQRLWFIDQLEPDNPLYNTPVALRAEGPLHSEVLRLTLGEVVRRHEALRTVFAAAPDRSPVQVVQPAGPFPLPLVDLSGLPENRRYPQALVLAGEEAGRPFDLARGPLLRGVLLCLAGEDHVLALTLHHITSDAWSMGILVREVAALYPAFFAGRPSPLPELPVQYADFAVWQRSWLEGEALESEISFWRRKLAGLPPLLELPTDRPRPAVQRHRGAVRRVRLPDGLTRQAAALGRREGATLFMMLLAGFQALLARYSGQDDLAVGSPVAGRNREEIEGLIGFFVNTLVMRGDLSGEPSFRELLGRVREATLDVYLHQDVPFEKLVEELAPERSLAQTPLFQVVLVLQNAPVKSLEIEDLRLRPVSVEATTAKFDLTVNLAENNGELRGTVEYATDLFDDATIGRFFGHFERLLAAAVAGPDLRAAELPLVSEPERQQFLEWGGIREELAAVSTLHGRFAERARQTPDAPALTCGDVTLTYGELDRRSNQLAHWLRGQGVGPESRVGLRLDRSVDLVVSILGVLKAGAAYVPLDPGSPRERAAFVVEDAEIRIVVENLEPFQGLPSHGLPVGDASSLAYVIYTSGSTGRPKGTLITHANVIRLFDATKAWFGFDERDVWTLFHSYTFDFSVWEIWGALLYGGRLVIVPWEVSRSPDLFLDLLRRERVTVLNQTPSAFAQLAQADAERGGVETGLRLVIFGGEALDPASLGPWFARHGDQQPRLVNMYGITETTVHVTYRPLSAADARSVIGVPIPDLSLAVVDPSLNPAPIGVPGELVVGGAGLARGYLGRPELTAERFIPDPAGGGARLYRSGDLGRFLPSGEVEYLGRIDHQVKIRGFRIELGEIETLLVTQAGVREAVVVASEDRRLVAYVVGDATAEAMRRSLRERLPDYMVPAAFVILPALPLTPNGKVDRKALPAPEQPAAGEGYVAPRTREEDLLAAVWAQVLRRPRVGVNDNFFELGGDSILSVQIAARARQAGLLFTVRQVFEHQTVAELARHAMAADPAGAVRAAEGPVAGEVPLTPIQRWFFEQGFADLHHFNQALLLELREPCAPAAFERAMAAVVEHHDALRMRFTCEAHDGAAGGWRQENAPAEPVAPFYQVDLSSLPAPRLHEAFERAAAALQAGFDLSAGPLTRLCLFNSADGQPARLLWVTHHLVVDGVSWRVLLEDLEGAYRQAARGLRPAFPPKTTSFQEWARRLAGHAGSDVLAGELEAWCETARVSVPRLPVDFPSGGAAEARPAGDEAAVSFELGAEETADLLQVLPSVYHSRIDDALLSALARALAGWTGSPRLRVDLEGHGREPLFDDLDVSRTVGWFTSIYPVVLETGDAGPGEALVRAKERLRAVPGRGIGYGLLRYLGDAGEEGGTEAAGLLKTAPAAEISFNYLGQVDSTFDAISLFRVSRASTGPVRSPRAHRTHLLEVHGIVADGRLRITLAYGFKTHRRETAERLAAAYAGALRQLIRHSRETEEVFTPSDFPKAGLDVAGFDRLARQLSGPVESVAGGLGLTLKNVSDVYPLSPLQNGMLFHSLMAPESGVYVTQVTCTLPADLEVRLFRQAWERLLERHEVLRTAFVWDGLDAPRQAVRKSCSLPWQDADWRGLPAEEQQRRFEELRHRDRHTPLPLTRAPLMRFSLARLDGELGFIWTSHHLLLDGWSLPLLVQELGSVYTALREGREPALPPVRPFSDYIVWLQKQDSSQAEPFWRGELSGFTSPSPLGIDHAPGTEGASVYAEHKIRISRELTAELQALAARHKLTLQTVTQGAWAVLLSRYSGEEDVVFGGVVSGRPAALPGVETMVGMFINTLPVRARVDGAELLAPWLQSLQKRQLARQEFEHSPLPQIQRLSEVPDGSPLFETLYVFENYPIARDGNAEGLRIGNLRNFESTNYPLTLILSAVDQLFLQLTYDRARIDEDAARRLLRHLTTLLSGMAEGPERRVGELGLLTAPEEHQLRAEWNDTSVPAAPGVVELFEAQARRSPEAVAVVLAGDEGGSLTYGALDRQADRLARRLRALGAGPDVIVGLCVERGPELVLGVLAILKSGSAWLSLDPAHPRARLAFMLEDAAVPLLVTRQHLLASLPPHDARLLLLEEPDEEEARGGGREGGASPGSPAPDSLAYLIYTSGTSGRPKAVQVEHGMLAATLAATRALFRFGSEDRMPCLTLPTFDIFLFELLSPLLGGGTAVLFPLRPTLDVELLVDHLGEMTCLHALPALMRHIVDALRRRGAQAPDRGNLRTVFIGGDAVPAALLEDLREAFPAARIWVLYGPTEGTILCTAYPVPPPPEPARPLLGRPLAGAVIDVRSTDGERLPIGVPGELWIGGAGVTRGYLGRADLTAEKYVLSGGERFYRSGDRVRRLADGSLEFLGRLDYQVKVRGFRIELGEIEAALASLPGVREAVVVAHEGSAADQRLIAYVAGDAAADTLRQQLRERLPDYMVPSAFVVLSALPLTANGKVDRKALPAPERSQTPAGGYTAPRSTLEQTIAEVWQEALGLDRVGRDDNFFDAGGHSLLMIQVHARLRERLGRNLTVVELFQYPTVQALAEHLGEGTAALPTAIPAPRMPRDRPAAGFAVIGMAGRFPGAANVEELWANLRGGQEAVVSFTDEEMRAAGVRPEMLADPRYVKSGAVLAGIDLFDAEFFGFSPREAEMMDPQHRLFLEASWQALENAGYDPRGVPGRVGVWGGADMSTYVFRLLARPDILKTAGLWAAQHGIDKDFLATRVSYELNLKGPSVAVQTACSTSLVAVHHACQSLACGECDTALAGGVHVDASQGTGYLYEKGAITSPDGRCRAFDAEARGTFSGSGVGVVVLKRLEDALRDGDTIRAVIRGTAINNDGSLKVGFTAPSVDGQAEVIATALAAAGVSPGTIGYVEAHGTGTPLGDPIEVAALTRAFRLSGARTEETGFCGLGSIKTNIGHLGAAAGVTGLIKTVLALEHRQIPPSLHFKTPNPAIDFAASPFRVVDRLTDWELRGAPRRAGVSSFGIGGTNAHAVLEEAPPAEPSEASRPLQLLLLSARTAGALEEATSQLATWLESRPEVPLADVAHTLRRGRHAFEHRRMLVCASREDALAALRSRDPERLLTRRKESDPPAVAWLLPGQGSQHPGMGRDLYETEPVFRREIDACSELLTPRLGRDLCGILFSSSGAELTETRLAQPALFAVEHALARLWLSWGLRPQALLGHSLGEYVAACLAGVLSLGDALALVAARGELMQELPPGAMLSIDLSEAETLGEIAAAPGLSLAAVNGPGRCVVSGPAAEIDALAERLARQAAPCRRLQTSHAFHSDMMEPILGRFAEIVSRVALQPPSIPYLSNLTGTWITAAEATDPGYWTRHLRETVRFGDNVSRLLAEMPPGAVLLEVGPGRSLGRLVRGQAAGRTVLATMPHPGSPESGPAALLQSAGRLWLTGVEIDWQAFQGEERRRRVPLPSYPFERQRFWVEAPDPGLTAGPAAVDPGRFVVLGGEKPVRAAADLRSLLRDPRNAEALERLLDAEPDLRVLLPRPPEAAPPLSPEAPLAPSRSVAGHRRPELPTPYVEPQGDLEQRLARIWGDLLGIDQVGVRDDFFELGGHSLLATRLLSRVREGFGREIPLETLFAEPTIARLAVHLAAAGTPQRSGAHRIPRARREGDPPLSFAQQQIWVLQQLDPANPAYSLPWAIRLRGALDPEAVGWSLREIVARHEVLRTTYPAVQGWPVQRIARETEVTLPLIDLGLLAEPRAQREVRELLERDALRPFDLAREPAFRALLLRLADDDHVLWLSFHHVCFDGWSRGVLFSELAALYSARRAGRLSPLPPLPLQYADFAAWQRQREGEIEEQLGWWKERLSRQTPLQLAPDRLHQGGQPAGAVEIFWLTPDLSGSLLALGQAEGCTLFVVLLALFKVLLHQRTGRKEISVGSPVAGRLSSEVEGLIGNFVNTLVLYTDLAGDPPFRELLGRVRETVLGAHSHQEVPYEQVAAALAGMGRRHRLFEVWFALHNMQEPTLELTGLTTGAVAMSGKMPRHDLSVSLWPGPQGIRAALEYRTDLFLQSTMRQMSEDFTSLAKAVVENAGLRCSALASLLEGAQKERQEAREQAARVAGLKWLGKKRREAV